MNSQIRRSVSSRLTDRSDKSDRAERPGRYPELDIFNAAACLLVILIHVLSVGISGLDRDSWQYAAVFFPWKLAAFVVPAFLFSGAVKLGMQLGGRIDAEQPFTAGFYGSYMLRRVTKIYIPYLVWVLIYFAVYAVCGLVEVSAASFFSSVLLGTVSAQFYYIVTVMQFWLLMPLWYFSLRRVPGVIGIPCALAVTMLMQRLPILLENRGLFPALTPAFAYSDRFFASYMVFWAAGLYAGRYYDALIGTLRRHRAAVYSSSLFVAGFSLLVYCQGRFQSWVYDANALKLVSDMLSILILLTLADHIRGSQMTRLRGLLSFIGEASFSVYLSHCLFLTVGTALLQSAGVTKIAPLILLRALICCTLPFALYAAERVVRRRAGGMTAGR